MKTKNTENVKLEKMLEYGKEAVYKVEFLDDAKVENKRLRHKRGVIVFLRELFEEANIKFEAYWSSIKFFVNGEEKVIYQQTNSKSGIEWFNFSDGFNGGFKGKSIKSFLRRVKKFLVQKIGNAIKEIFERLMLKLDKYLGHLVEDSKEEAKKAKVPVERKLVVASDGSFILKYWGLLKFTIKNGANKISVLVAEEFYEANKDKYLAVIKEIISEFKDVFNKFSGRNRLTIRQQKAWVIG